MMADKGQACDDCGLLFDSVHDVQRHMKNGWCPENREPLAKRMKIEESIESDIHPDDNIAFLRLWKGVKSNCKDKFDEIYQKYIDEDEDDATEMTEARIKPYEKQFFFRSTARFLNIIGFHY